MLMPYFWVAAGGGLGALARHFLSRWNRGEVLLPWGTLAANLSGSFLLGWITGAGWNPNAFLFAGTGFLGSFTTFSTLHWEAGLMSREKRRAPLVLYLGITYTLAILGAFAGYAAGSIAP